VTTVHPTAVVSSEATLGTDVQLGPYVVVEAGARIGDRCRIASHAVVKSGTTLGTDNQISEGAVLGGRPQHARAPEECGKLIIGDGNVIRETATLHRALDATNATIVGDNNLLMVGVHIGHDCWLGSNILIANSALVGGHVEIHDKSCLAAAVAIHQFCRIGAYTMIGGQARILKDVPPYFTVDGDTGKMVGLNLIGLRRSGFTGQQIQAVKEAYRTIYRSGLAWDDVLASLVTQTEDSPITDNAVTDNPVAQLHQFLASTSRGITQDRRPSPVPTLKVHRDEKSPSQAEAKRAG